MRDLCEETTPPCELREAKGEPLGEACGDPRQHAARATRRHTPWLLAPIDLQAIKAAGVTFAVSMLERVIEERARGDPEAAAAIRAEIVRLVGEDFARLDPARPRPRGLKEVLVAQGAWSQYLEVGIGPDAEIFTKAQPLSAVGTVLDAGIHPSSTWNNPEPEVVLAVASDRPHRRRDARQRRQPARLSRAARRCCCARRRTTTRPARSARCCASSTQASRSTTCAHDGDLAVEGEDGFVLDGSLLARARSAATRRIWSAR